MYLLCYVYPSQSSNRKLSCFIGFLKEVGMHQLWLVGGNIGKCDVLINVIFVWHNAIYIN